MFGPKHVGSQTRDLAMFFCAPSDDKLCVHLSQTYPDKMPKSKHINFRGKKSFHDEDITEDDGPNESQCLLLTLENNKRYAHTASVTYEIKMASLQPDDKRLPHCLCNSINEERRSRIRKEDKVILIVEHDLKENILCILEPEKKTSCKLNVLIRPGEQIAFRTIGRIPVLLSGFRHRS